MMADKEIRSGVEILADEPRTGPTVERKHTYLVCLKMWHNRVEPIRWQEP